MSTPSLSARSASSPRASWRRSGRSISTLSRRTRSAARPRAGGPQGRAGDPEPAAEGDPARGGANRRSDTASSTSRRRSDISRWTRGGDRRGQSHCVPPAAPPALAADRAEALELRRSAASGPLASRAARLAQGAERRSLELELALSDGSTLHAQLVGSGAPERTRGGTLRLALLDVTELRSLAARLAEAASAASLAEQQERRKLASDLHDDAGQLLSLASLKLRALADGGGRARRGSGSWRRSSRRRAGGSLP